MKILLFSGSLRKESLNKKLAQAAQAIIAKEAGCTAELIDLKSFEIPIYDGDVELLGIPQGVTNLGQTIKSADALVIASPEYNGSIASPLKNTIDWISRLKPVPFESKPILLMGASPGYFGTIRALSHTRVPLDAVGSFVFPQTLALPKAVEAFSSTGELSDAVTDKKLRTLISNYLQYAKKLTESK